MRAKSQVPDVPMRDSDCMRSLSIRYSIRTPSAPPSTDHVPLPSRVSSPATVTPATSTADLAAEQMSWPRAGRAAIQPSRIQVASFIQGSLERHDSSGLADHPREALPPQEGVHRGLDAAKVEPEQMG